MASLRHLKCVFGVLVPKTQNYTTTQIHRLLIFKEFKMSKTGKKRIQLSHCEVTNFLEYFTIDMLEEGIKKLSVKGKIDKWCYLLHDKDTYTEEDEEKNSEHKNGALKDPHYHLFIKFNGQVDLHKIAEAFQQPENYVKFIECGRYNGAIPYLVHRNAPKKFQYDPKEVKANFDYVKFIEDYDKKQNKISRLSEIQEGILNGTIREYNLHEHIKMNEYVKFKGQIEKSFEYVRKSKSAKQISKKCVFITGESGSGKTTYAKKWCESRGYSYVVSGSSNDPLECYKGQDVLILDDLRGSSFTFSDLLKILDNNTNSLAKSRYYNKFLECEYIIITSIVPIDEFYTNLFEHETEPLTQLKRRCTTYIEMNREIVKFFTYNKDKEDYDLVDVRKNDCPYLESEIVDDTVNEFAELYSKVENFDTIKDPEISLEYYFTHHPDYSLSAYF